MDNFFWLMAKPANYDFASLLMRLAVGGALLPFAIAKYKGRQEIADKFFSVFFMPPKMSFYMAMFMEGACSICLILGLFTRLAAVGGIVTMGIAAMMLKEPLYKRPSLPFVYGFIVVFFTGAGKWSFDYLLSLLFS